MKHCCGSKYGFVLTWYIIGFLALFVGGITVCNVTQSEQFVVYFTDVNGNIGHEFQHQSVNRYVGQGIIAAIVGCAGFIIACSYTCVISKDSDVPVQQAVQYQQVQNQPPYQPYQNSVPTM
ncbi:Hypothetical_protein [Hexamita inflata]|uniref:Hypothetical_protein n=1 Tax=Hexamita inflata TaxID=28002 RepID=A0AA86R9P1_9EUKA|nr:Hypothetical protein HINF_LOCUS62059 [Hexamita inflata]